MIEWTGSHEQNEDVKEGILVRAAETVEKLQKPLGFRDKYIGFRLLIPVKCSIFARPDLTGY